MVVRKDSHIAQPNPDVNVFLPSAFLDEKIEVSLLLDLPVGEGNVQAEGTCRNSTAEEGRWLQGLAAGTGRCNPSGH